MPAVHALRPAQPRGCNARPSRPPAHAIGCRGRSSEGGGACQARCGNPCAPQGPATPTTGLRTPRPQPMEDAMEQTVRTLQDRVNAALLGSDWQTLNDLIATDARIIGPRGFIIDRDTWIGVHKESEYQQVRLQASDTEVHTYDHAGIRFDVVDSECTYKGETITGRFRVTQVWVTDHQKWQLAAVQYTSLP